MSESYKVILIGYSFVGKTGLITRFDSNKFEQEILPTVNNDYLRKEVTIRDNQRVCLEIWDTAGQEKFLSITKPHFRGANVAVICIPIHTDEAEVEKQITYWENEVKENEANCKFIVAITKADISLPDQKAGMIREVAKRHDMESYQTSAKTGEGIEDLFNHVAVLASQTKPKPELPTPTGHAANIPGVRGRGCC